MKGVVDRVYSLRQLEHGGSAVSIESPGGEEWKGEIAKTRDYVGVRRNVWVDRDHFLESVVGRRRGAVVDCR